MPYRFRWTCSYAGCVTFMVYGEGEPFEVEVRRRAVELERRRLTGGDAAFVENIAKIGLLQRRSWSQRGVSPELVEAFNRWHAGEHAAMVKKFRDNPDRYGVIADDDPLLAPPCPVYGGAYIGSGRLDEPAPGWLVNGSNRHGVFPCAECGGFEAPEDLVPIRDSLGDVHRRVCRACASQEGVAALAA